MRQLLIGIIIGFILGTALTAGYAAMSGNANQRNYDKYSEDSGGDTCVLVTISE